MHLQCIHCGQWARYPADAIGGAMCCTVCSREFDPADATRSWNTARDKLDTETPALDAETNPAVTTSMDLSAASDKVSDTYSGPMLDLPIDPPIVPFDDADDEASPHIDDLDDLDDLPNETSKANPQAFDPELAKIVAELATTPGEAAKTADHTVADLDDALADETSEQISPPITEEATASAFEEESQDDLVLPDFNLDLNADLSGESEPPAIDTEDSSDSAESFNLSEASSTVPGNAHDELSDFDQFDEFTSKLVEETDRAAEDEFPAEPELPDDDRLLDENQQPDFDELDIKPLREPMPDVEFNGDDNFTSTTEETDSALPSFETDDPIPGWETDKLAQRESDSLPTFEVDEPAIEPAKEDTEQSMAVDVAAPAWLSRQLEKDSADLGLHSPGNAGQNSIPEKTDKPREDGSYNYDEDSIYDDFVEPPKPRATGFYKFGLAILAIALLGQLIWWQRDNLLGYKPLRDSWALACSQLGCTVPPASALDKIAIERHRLVMPAEPGAPAELRLVLHNKANFDQHWPTLRVSYNDAQGRAKAGGRYPPEEYHASLNGSNSDILFAANERIFIQLPLQLPAGIEPAGYDIILE